MCTLGKVDPPDPPPAPIPPPKLSGEAVFGDQKKPDQKKGRRIGLKRLQVPLTATPSTGALNA